MVVELSTNVLKASYPKWVKFSKTVSGSFANHSIYSVSAQIDSVDSLEIPRNNQLIQNVNNANPTTNCVNSHPISIFTPCHFR